MILMSYLNNILSSNCAIDVGKKGRKKCFKIIVSFIFLFVFFQALEFKGVYDFIKRMSMNQQNSPCFSREPSLYLFDQNELNIYI